MRNDLCISQSASPVKEMVPDAVEVGKELFWHFVWILRTQWSPERVWQVKDRVIVCK